MSLVKTLWIFSGLRQCLVSGGPRAWLTVNLKEDLFPILQIHQGAGILSSSAFQYAGVTQGGSGIPLRC